MPSEMNGGRWQFSLLALMVVVTGFAFVCSMMKSLPSESWVGAAGIAAVAVGIGSAVYEIYRKPGC